MWRGEELSLSLSLSLSSLLFFSSLSLSFSLSSLSLSLFFLFLSLSLSPFLFFFISVLALFLSLSLSLSLSFYLSLHIFQCSKSAGKSFSLPKHYQNILFCEIALAKHVMKTGPLFLATCHLFYFSSEINEIIFSCVFLFEMFIGNQRISISNEKP